MCAMHVPDNAKRDVCVWLVRGEGLTPEQVVAQVADGVGQLDPFEVTVEDVLRFVSMADAEDEDVGAAFDDDPLGGIEVAARAVARQAVERLQLVRRRSWIGRPEDDRQLKWAQAQVRSASATLRTLGRRVPLPDEEDEAGDGEAETGASDPDGTVARMLDAHRQPPAQLAEVPETPGREPWRPVERPTTDDESVGVAVDIQACESLTDTITRVTHLILQGDRAGLEALARDEEATRCRRQVLEPIAAALAAMRNRNAEAA
jgi:hypothetical protein